MERKHISWKTKAAAALAELGNVRYGIPYNDVKHMTEAQFLSLWHFDNNKLHSFKGGDHFSNLTPMLIKAHREKTKRDAKIIAKGRRLEKRQEELTNRYIAMGAYHDAMGGGRIFHEVFKPETRKIRSRGFDKTKRRKMSGQVVPR